MLPPILSKVLNARHIAVKSRLVGLPDVIYMPESDYGDLCAWAKSTRTCAYSIFGVNAGMPLKPNEIYGMKIIIGGNSIVVGYSDTLPIGLDNATR